MVSYEVVPIVLLLVEAVNIFLQKKLPQINKQALFVKLVTKKYPSLRKARVKAMRGVGLFNYRG